MKKILKGVFAIGCIAFPPDAAQAQEELQPTKMVVATADGKTWEYAMSDLTGLNFANASMLLIGQSTTFKSFALTELKGFKFLPGKPTITDIPNILTNEGCAKLRQDGDRVSVDGIGGQARMQIYNVNGQCIASTVGTATEGISIKSLPHGVYILRVNNATFKFSK